MVISWPKTDLPPIRKNYTISCLNAERKTIKKVVESSFGVLSPLDERTKAARASKAKSRRGHGTWPSAYVYSRTKYINENELCGSWLDFRKSREEASPPASTARKKHADYSSSRRHGLISYAPPHKIKHLRDSQRYLHLHVRDLALIVPHVVCWLRRSGLWLVCSQWEDLNL